VPETEEGGAEAELQYVEVIEDTEGTQANPVNEASPGAINPVFKILMKLSMDDCAFTFRSLYKP
jgi:hypothetical protein